MDKFESEAEKIRAVLNMLGNIQAEFDNTARANDKLAMDFTKFIGQLERGEVASQVEFAHYFNKAMELTKADPLAGKGALEDKLLAISQFIIRYKRLRFKLPDFLLVLLYKGEEELIGSQRAHFASIWNFLKETIEQIYKKYKVVDYATVYPAPGGEQKTTETSSKLKFKKVN